jgi:hypothetical protein
LEAGIKLVTKRFWLYALILGCATFIVYLPSLAHLLRSETYIYFMNTQGDNSFWSLITHYFNYTQTQVYDPGDPLLFRPLGYAVLGFEKWAFGFNYIGWRIFGLALHLLVCLCLFRLLWKIKPNVLTLIVSLFFSTMFIGINAVLYENVSLYMVFTVLVLTAIYYLYSGLKDNKPYYFYFVGLVMLIVCFIYELGIVFLCLFIGYLWLKHYKKYAFILSFIIPIYVVCYLIRLILGQHDMLHSEVSSVFNLQYLVSFGVNLFIWVKTWFCQIILPSSFSLVAVPNLGNQPVGFAMSNGYVLIGLNIIALAVLVYVVIPSKKFLKLEGLDKQFLILSFVMACIFLLSNLIFRGGNRGISYILNTNISAYMFLAWLSIAIFILFKNVNTKQVKLASVAFLVVICISSWMVFSVSRELNQVTQQSRDYLKSVDDFVAQHKGEPDFSFYVERDEYLKFNTDIGMFRYGESIELYPIPKIYYPKYWNKDNPKYKLMINSDGLIAVNQ